MQTRTWRTTAVGILALVGVIWLAFLLGRVVPLERFGLEPRQWSGLSGIVAMPFLHANWAHILGNTIPLVVLLILLAGSRARSWLIVLEIVLVSGGLLWLCGRPGNHIGASGLISGLITFLIIGGILERRLVPLLIAGLTFFWYGGSLLWGLLPITPGVSWDGHLCGAVAGGLLAAQMIVRRTPSAVAPS